MKNKVTVEDTYWDRVNSLSIELDILFLGFLPRHKDKSKTRCKMFCLKHRKYWETTTICNFLRRKVNPCKDCAMGRRLEKTRVTEKEYLPKVIAACKRYNTEFIDWTGSYRGVQSIITHRCKIHGTVTSDTHARSLVENKNKTSGCICCKSTQYNTSIKSKETLHVSQFMSTGMFVEGTSFTKSDRVTNAGVRNYWDVFCPRCEEINEAFTGSLKNGSLPCSCAEHCYGYFPKREGDLDTLYLLLFEGRDGMFVKVGRSFCVDRRTDNMKAESGYEISKISLIENSHINVFKQEQHLLELLSDFHYQPSVEFGGSVRECFTLDILNHPEITSSFNLKPLDN